MEDDVAKLQSTPSVEAPPRSGGFQPPTHRHAAGANLIGADFQRFTNQVISSGLTPAQRGRADEPTAEDYFERGWTVSYDLLKICISLASAALGGLAVMLTQKDLPAIQGTEKDLLQSAIFFLCGAIVSGLVTWAANAAFYTTCGFEKLATTDEEKESRATKRESWGELRKIMWVICAATFAFGIICAGAFEFKRLEAAANQTKGQKSEQAKATPAPRF